MYLHAWQVRAVLPAYFSDPGFEPPAELLDMTFCQTVSDLTMSALGQYDLTEEVARLDHRVLILFGEDDPFDLSMAEMTREALAAAQVELWYSNSAATFGRNAPTGSMRLFARSSGCLWKLIVLIDSRWEMPAGPRRTKQDLLGGN